MAGNDFVQVELTGHGIAFAQGASLQVNGRTSLSFVPGQAQRVARYEWDLMLAHLADATGEPLFTLVTAQQAAQDKPAATPAVAAVKENA